MEFLSVIRFGGEKSGLAFPSLLEVFMNALLQNWQIYLLCIFYFPMGSLESCAVYLEKKVEYHSSTLKIAMAEKEDSSTWLTTNV